MKRRLMFLSFLGDFPPKIMMLSLKQGTFHFESTLGFYPAYTGLKNCHLRALYAVLPRAAKLALSSKVKHNNSLKIFNRREVT